MKRPRVLTTIELKQEERNYKKNKKEMLEKLEKKRVSETRSTLNDTSSLKKYQTEISKMTQSRDEEIRNMKEAHKIQVTNQIRKRNLYADQVK